MFFFPPLKSTKVEDKRESRRGWNQRLYGKKGPKEDGETGKEASGKETGEETRGDLHPQGVYVPTERKSDVARERETF